jgi:two-component system KDP operon response regulator KdpE
MSRPRVLLVDDEPQILRFLRPALEAGGFDPVTATTADEAIKLAAAQAPDVILLDLGLPDRDGKEVIREIRTWSRVPIIVLSARDREAEKIDALDLGADDYVNKPFAIGELLARIRAAQRHKVQAGGGVTQYKAAGLEIDTQKHTVRRGGTEIHLTPKEFDLLVLLMRSAGRLLTHRQILNAVWGPAHSLDVQYLRVFIRQLRGKIEADPNAPGLIITEPGLGYRFKA